MIVCSGVCVCVQSRIEERLDDAIHVLRNHAEAGQHPGPYPPAAESATRTLAGVFTHCVVSVTFCCCIMSCMLSVLLEYHTVAQFMYVQL